MGNIIRYPKRLQFEDKIAVCAPSSGVERELHLYLTKARENVEQLGFKVVEGDTLWTNNQCVSAPKEIRAQELQQFLLDETVRAIIPPWGGEFLMEILPLLDWEALKSHEPKWILGYSDTSTFSFAYTLTTGYASAHGPNYFEFCASEWDSLTSKWSDVLGTGEGGTVHQISSKFYQSSWVQTFRNPDKGFNLDTPTKWKWIGHEDGSHYEVEFTGRLLGGCMDTLSILIGTPFAPVNEFVEKYFDDSGVIWYLESAEMSAADIYRHLWQMKMNGWFNKTNGVLIGRPAGYSSSKGFELKDALHATFDDLGIPVIYNVDIGHVPPQLTLVNGSLAKVKFYNGQGSIDMMLR